MGFHLIRVENLLDLFHGNQNIVGYCHISLSRFRHSSRMRSYCSQRDISERTTSSPSLRPCRISTLLTELRPRAICTREAVLPSGSSLKTPIALFSWPNAGRV